jgi:hypothetical protein
MCFSISAGYSWILVEAKGSPEQIHAAEFCQSMTD